LLPLISIIIPTHNHASVICDAINSVLNQTVQDFEIIIVDDGSDDETERILSEFYDDKRILYFRQKHSGLSAARNFGFKYVKGTYLQFLDADDIIFPDKFERHLKILEKEPELNSTHSEFTCIDGITRETLPKYASAATNKDLFLDELVLRWEKSLSIPIHCFLFNIKIFNGMKFRVGLPNHEDWEFYIRLAEKGWFSHYFNEVLCAYRIFPESMARDDHLMLTGYDKVLEGVKLLSFRCQQLVERRRRDDEYWRQ